MAEPEDLSELLERRRRKQLEVPAGEAITVTRAAATRIVVDDVELVFLEDGPLIIMPLARWSATLQRAVAQEQVKVEARSRQDRRRMARELRKDARN